MKNKQSQSTAKNIPITSDSSQNKIIEKVFTDDEEKYRTLFNYNRDSITIFRFDSNGDPCNFIETNPATTEIFGYTKQELMSLSITDIESLDTSHKEKKSRLKQLKSTGKIDFETIIRNKNGCLRNIEIESLLINYLNAPAVMNIARDITERKQLELNAKKVHENLNSLLDAIPDLLFEVDFTGIIHHYQSRRDDLLLHSPAEFIGKNILNLLPPNVTNVIFDAIHEATAKGWSTGHQYNLDLPKGICWFELSVSPISGSDINNKHYIVLVRDISQRKKAEEGLREKEEKLQGIFNVANSGIVLIDKKQNFILFNDWCCELLGYTREEFSQLTTFDITHPDDLRKSNTNLNKISEGKIDKYQLEKRYLKKDKSFVWCEINASSIKDKNNAIVNVICIISDISERKKIEEKLIANDTFLNQVQSIANIGSYSIDINTGKWTSSIVLDSIFGIDENFIKSTEGWQLIIHPEWRKTIYNYFNEKIITQKNDFNKDYKIIRINDQEERWVSAIGKIIYNELNEPTQLIGTIQDITTQKNTEQSLRESEEKYRSLVENSPDAVVIYINGKIVFINNEGVRLTKAKNKEEVLGKTVLEFIHPDSVESVMQRMIDVVRNNNTSDAVEEKLIDLYGNAIDAELKTIPMIFNNQQAVQVIIHDITERKHSQEKIKQLSQAVEQSPVAIVITNTDGIVEYVNSKFIENTGYSYEEIIGNNPRILKSGHTSPTEYKQLWQTISSGNEWFGEFHNKKKDGTLYWESASISPIINTQGITTHYIAIKEDITERKIIEQQLIDAKNKAEESDRLKLAFLANMSHEIRTPMNGILGFTELLKTKELPSDIQQEYINIIEQSGERMLNIINDIISISKIESGQIEVSESETNVNEQFNYLQTFFKPEVTNKKIALHLTKELSPQDTFIKTDREKLYAVLTNLIKNAIKFTSHGSIEFGCEKKGNILEFFVKDTGLGISTSQQKIIFERFRQANDTTTRTHEGSGLGLSISKAFIEMQGGTIWVESQEGVGSTFYFTLPFHSEYQNKENRLLENKTIETEEVNNVNNLKVLIVEDDAISKLLITIAVKPYSKEILKVSSGIDAIETCRNNPDIDLIMMDINLPGMGGYEATKEIRKYNKDIVIIAQTANGMQSDYDEAIEAGLTDYISKPINISSLSKLINKYFKK